MRRFICFVVVVLVGFVATGCATGGAYRSPLEQVMASNNDMICSISGDVFVDGPKPFRGCLQDLLQLGHSRSRMVNYPMHLGGSNGPLLSGGNKLAIFCGLGGAGITALLDAGWKSIFGVGALSATACEIATAVATRGKAAQQPQGQSGQQSGSASPFWGPGAPFGGRPDCAERLLVTLLNQTGEVLGVTVEGQRQGQPTAILSNKRPNNWACAPPHQRYEAWSLETGVSADGWIGGTQNIPKKPEARPGLVLVWR